MFFDLIIHKLSDELLNYCPALIHEKGGYLCCLRIEEGDCLRLYDTDGGGRMDRPSFTGGEHVRPIIMRDF